MALDLAVVLAMKRFRVYLSRKFSFSRVLAHIQILCNSILYIEKCQSKSRSLKVGSDNSIPDEEFKSMLRILPSKLCTDLRPEKKEKEEKAKAKKAQKKQKQPYLTLPRGKASQKD